MDCGGARVPALEFRVHGSTEAILRRVGSTNVEMSSAIRKPCGCWRRIPISLTDWVLSANASRVDRRRSPGSPLRQKRSGSELPKTKNWKLPENEANLKPSRDILPARLFLTIRDCSPMPLGSPESQVTDGAKSHYTH